MPPDSFPTRTGQIVDFIRQGILTGRWRDTIPGRGQLTEELGVSHTTVEEAIRRLVKEGLLTSAGAGKRKQIVLPKEGIEPKHIRVRIINYEHEDRNLPIFIDLLDRIKNAGFPVEFSSKSLLDLGMDVKRVAKFIQQNPPDAWIVCSASRTVLERFIEQPIPTYAMFGGKYGLPIAGCAVRTDIQQLIERLVDLGHRRIVLLNREEQLLPTPSLFPQRFLDLLQKAGIKPGSYNLPVWGYRPEGLRECLASLYKVSPPTALIASEAPIFNGVRDYLARRGILAPRHVSLISLNPDPSFEWCDPQAAHYTHNYTTINRHILRWAEQVAQGKNNRHQIAVMAKFVEGGTIGPAPKI